jgi:hypothetical protein
MMITMKHNIFGLYFLTGSNVISANLEMLSVFSLVKFVQIHFDLNAEIKRTNAAMVTPQK